MSHDADKLIRQLSLVAFLMAERRLLTARDVKSNVEGYSEMSDEAFARRFYSDRAELTALGIPLQSQRDEFTGEELYTLRSENYFLERLDLDDDELAALQTALYYLEGKFAYAEPFRLALQNLALGRVGFAEPPTDTAERVRVSAPDYSPELAGRLAKLESAISKQRTVRFGYWSPRRARPGERSSIRMRCVSTRATGTSWAMTSIAGRPARSRSPVSAGTFASQRAASATSVSLRSSTSRSIESRARGRSARSSGTRGSRSPTTPPGGSSARSRTPGTSRTGYSRPTSPTSICSPAGCCDRTAEPFRSSPSSCVDAVGAALSTLVGRARRRCPGRRRPEANRPAPAPPGTTRRPGRAGALRRAAGSPRPPARRLRRRALTTLDAVELAARFSIPLEELQDHLSLLNLVNFGGGCYAVYAQHDGDVVRVEKELYGDVFRRPPKLTPLEARAIQLAMEYVGPTIAADAHTPLKRVRKKLEETFGRFDLAGESADARRLGRGDARPGAVRRCRQAAVVELEYLKEGDDSPTLRQVEPYTIERELPVWRVHTWDLSVDAAARSGSTGCVRRGSRATPSSLARDSILRTCETLGSHASSTRPRSRVGSSSAARASHRRFGDR